MSSVWLEEDEEVKKVGGARAVLRAKPRFSFNEIKVLLEEVKRNRYIILKKFNHGVSAEAKKQTWADITEQINDLGENHREVRQIMKKWADLKCDGKRRMAAFRGPQGSNLRKKNLGPVERMVHKILLMTPGADYDLDEDIGTRRRNVVPPSPFYLNTDTNSLPLPGGASFDLSPLSSPEKELGGDPLHSSPEFEFEMAADGEQTMDYDDEDTTFSSHPGTFCPPSSSSNPLESLPDNPLLRSKPFHTYSRNNASSYSASSSRPPPRTASISSGFPSSSNSEPSSSSSLAPPQSPTNSSSSVLASSLSAPRPSSPLNSYSSPSVLCAANGTTTDPAAASSSLPPPPSYPSATASSSTGPPSCSVSSSSLHPPPVTSYSQPSSSSLLPPNRLSSSLGSIPYSLPPGASSVRAQEHVAQLASQSLQQQQASRRLLESVSQSLDSLAQSVQLLVESQQEFVQESLMLQKETVDILKDFSITALAMLREKPNHGHNAAPHQPGPQL
ncbi:uncharacterized protein zgc:113149 [Lampris incognitus]|uniref:uncharacterized protein zgc:113149 n=1 Tax=Lampris incognitus TaxID=2546036 RepID=UPI0024B514E5|nr:uncharacterized protein zgc:113149 [Lampris incognitus]XP_056139990.1 uncharacterized protein zgc:113149 [Lampris incognitus]